MEANKQDPYLTDSSLTTYQHKVFCLNCQHKIETCPNCEGFFEKTFFNEFHKVKCLKITEKQKLIIWEGDKFEEEEDDIIVIENDIIKKMCKTCSVIFPEVLFKEHKYKCAMIYEENLKVLIMIPCQICHEKFSKVLIEEHEEKCKNFKRREENIKKSELKFEYPNEWTLDFIKNDKGLEPSLYKITTDNIEWDFCKAKFEESVYNINITNIYRIQHKYLYEKYQMEKLRLLNEKGYTEEKWLFHGSRYTEPKKIYMKGFDICFANQGRYGYGIYFAKWAIYSYQQFAYFYCGKNYIFLCKVLTGESYFSSKPYAFTKPPMVNEEKNIFYDSVTNLDPKETKIKDLNHMYIVYENDKAYPFYIIEYDLDKFKGSRISGPKNPIEFIKN
jgi:hypothetical protein